jgi:hypothetical protein
MGIYLHSPYIMAASQLYLITELAGVDITLYTCVWWVLGENLGRGTGYSDFPQSLLIDNAIYANRGSVVSIAISCGLDGLGVGFRTPAETRFSSLLHVVIPVLESTQCPIQWVPGALSQRIKRPGVSSWPLTFKTSAVIKKTWTYTSTPPYTFMA